MSTKIIKIDTGFTIDIETNLNIVDLLDITSIMVHIDHIKSQTHISKYTNHPP